MSQLQGFVEFVTRRLWAAVVFQDPAETGEVLDPGGLAVVRAIHRRSGLRREVGLLIVGVCLVMKKRGRTNGKVVVVEKELSRS